ncbi:MAG: N-acetylmuramoyl-L-alanine amidase [Lachnospiraceae bacterium]|nr:N-acetylmuramoyl-L-alanine amidase [Lachnospiraceae bacterium]
MAKKRVCLDAGHYGRRNRCPGIKEYYESEMVWKLHLLQKKYLEQLGIEVITTREEREKDLALKTRGKASKECDLFISDHSNAVGNSMNEDVDYVAVYCLTDDTTTWCDDISREIAEKLAPVITEVMEVKQGYKVLTRKASSDRNGDGMMNDNYYGVLNGARLVNVPGLILEHSFHTNSRTVKWLLQDDNLDKLARAEAECIASYLLGKKVTLDTEKESPVANTLYKVQVGAFEKLDYAKELLQNVKSKNFDAILVKADNLYKVQVGAFKIKSNAEAMLKKVELVGFDAFITTGGGLAVNNAATKKEIEVGSSVMVKRGAKTYTGGSLADYVYTRKHKVSQLSGERAVITYNGVVVAAVKVSDLELG